MKCKACGDLGYVTNGLSPDKVCPFCDSLKENIRIALQKSQYELHTLQMLYEHARRIEDRKKVINMIETLAEISDY